MKSEKDLEQYLRQKVRAAGGEAVKLEGVKGIPDRLLLFPSGRAIFCELKSPGGTGRLSPMQARWLKRLEGLGFDAVVVSSKAEADALVIGNT